MHSPTKTVLAFQHFLEYDSSSITVDNRSLQSLALFSGANYELEEAVWEKALADHMSKRYV